MRVCLSGFDQNIKGILSGQLTEMGIEYTQVLDVKIDLLVSKVVTSEKYIVASKLGVHIVSQNWVSDNFTKFVEFTKKHNKKDFTLTSFEEYKLPYLSGLTVGIIGFVPKMTEDIKTLIHREGGNYYIGEQEIVQAQQNKNTRIDLILARKQVVSQKKIGAFLRQLQKPTVPLEWIINCQDFGVCIDYNKYNLISIRRKSRKESLDYRIKKGSSNMDFSMKNVSANSEKHQYFSQCFIHFGQFKETQLLTLKTMVDIGGGFVVDDIYPCTTHVISEEMDLDLRKKCMKFRKVQMVNAQWILDSCKFLRKPVEAHYLSIAPTVQSQPLIRANSNTNSQSFQQLGQVLMIQGFNPQSDKSKPLKKTSKKKLSKSNKLKLKRSRSNGAFKDKTSSQNIQKLKIKSELFLGIKFQFYEPKSKRVTKEMDYFAKKVHAHSGEFKKPDKVRKSLFQKYQDPTWTIKIAPDEEDFFQQGQIFMIKPLKKNMIVSTRWIDYCIEKNVIFTKFNSLVFRTLLPFQHIVPFQGFLKQKVYFCVSGFQSEKKDMLKRLGVYLGAHYTSDLKKMNILIVGLVGSMCNKVIEYNKKYEDSTQIIIVKPEWLTACVREGKLKKIAQYAMQLTEV